jgi:hypothetical protein
MQQAQHNLHETNQELRKLTYWDIAYAPLNATYDKAAVEWFKGVHYHNLARKANGDELVFSLGRAIRAFTRCQALANQVHDALLPPPASPEALGLRPWFGDWGEWAEAGAPARE